jgi:drug/metabolite transporter (DMT)-like permease
VESARRIVEPTHAAAAEATMPTSSSSPPTSRWAIALALFLLYAVWGSTYLAMRVALEGFPPFRMGALRFLVAGTVLFLVTWARGARLPSRLEWRNSIAIGTLLLAIGNGGVAYAELTVSSGLSALVVSAMPLWMAFFSGVFGKWPSAGDWAALALGAVGIVLLNFGSELHAQPAGMFALLLGSASWAFGSLWSRRLKLPTGSMAVATQMLGGGAVLYLASLLRGEHLTALPSLRSVAALAYLAAFGSLVAFSAYLYLLARVRPTVASSYAYVNPVVAMLLGAALAQETIPPLAFVATPLILASVAIVLRPRRPGGARAGSLPAVETGAALRR